MMKKTTFVLMMLMVGMTFAARPGTLEGVFKPQLIKVFEDGISLPMTRKESFFNQLQGDKKYYSFYNNKFYYLKNVENRNDGEGNHQFSF